MQSGLGLSVATGAAWMVGLRWAHRLVGIVSVAFLARLLAPGDFGLVALATTVVAFIELFGQTQVDAALIREQGADRMLYDSAWTLDILRGSLVALALTIAAAPVAVFFSEPRVEFVLYALAGIQLIGSFQNVGTVEFRKNFRFGRDFLFEFLSRVAGACLTIAAAIVFRNHWALVAGIALQGASRLVLSYLICDYRPRLCFARLREIFNFSKWMIVQQLSYGLREQAPVFAVSRLLNVETLGLFNVSKELSAFVTTELRVPIRRALYPGFARMSVESGALKANYIDAFAIMFLFSLPISVGLYLVADLVIEVVFGPQWLPAVPLLKILAVLGIVQSFGANTHLVLNRMGRPKVTAIAGIGYLIVFVPLLFWATVKYGVHGAAWAIVLSSALTVLTEYAIMRRVLGVRFAEMSAHIWRPVLAAACMVNVIVIARGGLHPIVNLPSAAWLAGTVVIGAVLYVGTTLAAWRLSGAGPGAERHVLQTLSRVWPRRWLIGTSS